MSHSTEAVFLSYASQDADAARRICETLRGAGVETWFDADGGLEHGDEWDAKIRKQIKECVLFIPIISAHTQARLEGYFRLEWELAAQRAMSIASGVPFILPVVIDGTREPEALVPDRFRAVQWTKLPGGVVTPEVKARYLKLWLHRIGAVNAEAIDVGRGRRTSPREESKERTAGAGDPAHHRTKRSRWLLPAIAAGITIVGGAVWKNASSSKPQTQNSTPTSAVGQAASPELASLRARIVPDRWTRGDYEVIKASLDRLIQANPEQAEAWALRSIIASLQVVRTFDYGTGMLMAGKADAERTLRLVPGLPLGDLALGLHYVAMTTRGGDARAASAPIARAMRGLPRDALTRYVELAEASFTLRLAEVERLCLAWLQEDPAATFPLWVLAGNRLCQRSATDAESWAERAAQAGNSITGVRALVSLYEIKFFLRADLPAARAAIDRVPAESRSIHRVVLARWQQALAERRWDEAIQELARVPDAVLYDRMYHGPKALLAGIAHQKAGRAAPAAAQLADAERALRELLRGDPDDEDFRTALALTLAYAGRTKDARDELSALEPLVRGRPAYLYSGFVQARMAETYAVLGDVDAALGWLRMIFAGPSAVPYTPASFRLDPRFENLANDLRVQAMWNDLAPRADPKSVAVLAFTNVGGDKDNEALADGIADELLTVLQKIPGLRVAARTSAFSFKGKNATVQEVGEKLGMVHVVEGTVQRFGNRVKITARLSRAATNEEVWEKSFGPLELTDIFATQSELAQAIVRELRGKLTGEAAATAKADIQAQVAAAEKGGTKNVEAHQLYLQGKFLAAQFSQENSAQAVEFFRQAVKIDSGFALAWAALSRTNSVRWMWGSLAPDVDRILPEARQAADRALALEPEMAEGYAASCEAQISFEFDWRGAEASATKALALAPSDASIVCNAAKVAMFTGKTDRALEWSRQAVALDPANTEIRLYLAAGLAAAGRPTDAAAEYRRALAINPSAAALNGLLSVQETVLGHLDEALALAAREREGWSFRTAFAVAYWAKHDQAKADTALRDLIDHHANDAAFNVAEVYGFRGDAARAIAWLERAQRQRDGGVAWIKVDQLFVKIHDDPRWLELLKKVGLADGQLK